MSRFLERLAEEKPIVADGGMGALLSSAVAGLRCPEEANLRSPESVLEVHLGFIRAGAELIETNSFGANRAKLARQFLADELEQINAAAVRVAREAREVAGRDVFIAGSIGPLGDVELSGYDRATLYAEQAQILEGRGVDVFMVETFYDLEELETAVESIRSVSALPLVALLTFDAGGETLAGVKAEDAAARLRPLGLAAYGANHGAGPAAALTALARMGGDGAVLAALPNVGLASMSGQRIVFPHATPDYFAEFAAQARELGARLIGGCCGTTPAVSAARGGEGGAGLIGGCGGTTPAQVAAIREAVDANRRPAGSFLVRERARVAPFETTTGETQLAGMLREGEFAISVQVDPPLGANPEALIETAKAVRESGRAQFVDVNDNPRARARMSGIMASVAIERFTGVETIPHLTPRDTTITGLESLLLGAHAEGVRNILAVTGDPPEAGDYPGTHAVYDVDSVGLVELIAKLNAGEDWHGRAIDAPTTFFPGVAVNPTADDLELEAERFRRKVAAGACFAMTQVLFDLEALEAFRERIGGWPVPVLVGVWPIRTTETLVRVHNEVPGIVVPEHVQARYRAAGTGARGVGLALGRELIEGARELASGIYVLAPFRRPLDVVELLPEPG